MSTIEELRERYEEAYRGRVLTRRINEAARVDLHKAEQNYMEARKEHSNAKLNLDRFIRESVGVTNGAD